MKKPTGPKSLRGFLPVALILLWFTGAENSKKKFVPELSEAYSNTFKTSAKWILPDLNHPDSIEVYRDQLFITDKEKLHVFSLNDFKKVHEFGIRVQGPGEFIPLSGNPETGNNQAVISSGRDLGGKPQPGIPI